MPGPERSDDDAPAASRPLWSPPAPGSPGAPDDGDVARTEETARSPWAPPLHDDRPRDPAQQPTLDPDDPTRTMPAAPPAWPQSSAPPRQPRAGTGRAALMGALAGAVVAALVAGGVTLALDDDPAAPERRDVTPVTSSDGGLDIQGILAKVQPSVVAIETSAATSRGVFEGAGSGIVLSEDGHILTNAHVVGSSLGDIVVVLGDGTEHEAELVGSTPDDDMAVIKIGGAEGLVAADLGSSDDLRVGDEVIAIGNALNLGSEPTVTLGIVSATDRDLSAEGITLEGLIQTDAAINPGNSGGPLVNAAGQVVGMNTAIVADAQNLGFAIAIDRARPIIEQLESGEGAITPDQAFLGVSSTPLDGLNEQVRSRFGIDRDDGAFVAEVVPGSAADDAGIEVGDVIVEIDGDTIDEPADVRDAIVGHEPGDSVEIVLVRDGDERTIEVELGRRGDN